MPAVPAIRLGENRSIGAIPALNGNTEAIRREFAVQASIRNQEKAD